MKRKLSKHSVQGFKTKKERKLEKRAFAIMRELDDQFKNLIG